MAFKIKVGYWKAYACNSASACVFLVGLLNNMFKTHPGNCLGKMMNALCLAGAFAIQLREYLFSIRVR